MEMRSLLRTNALDDDLCRVARKEKKGGKKTTKMENVATHQATRLPAVAVGILLAKKLKKNRIK